MSNIHHLFLGNDDPKDAILPYPTIKLSEECCQVDNEDLHEAVVMLGRFQRGTPLSIEDIATIFCVVESISDAQEGKMTHEQKEAVKLGVR